MLIPKLKKEPRIREYKKYTFIQISRIVKKWLKDKTVTNRSLDRDILELDPLVLRGYETHGIRNYLGLSMEFKGLFENISTEESIKLLRSDSQDFSLIIRYLEYKEDDLEFIVTEKLFEKGKKSSKKFSENYENQLKNLNSTDSLGGKNYSRKEQAILKSFLFENKKEIQCALCHKTLPADMVWAAHIKPRKDCSEKERTDVNIVMPACKIGCDDLFEKNYIKIDTNGYLLINKSKTTTTQMNNFMKQYENKKCLYFKIETKEYFNFRFEMKS